jgi:copper chaperone CopZ/predicted methyltransferase
MSKPVAATLRISVPKRQSRSKNHDLEGEGEPRRLGEIMARARACVIVGVLACVTGALSVRLADHGPLQRSGSASVDIRSGGDQSAGVTPRGFAIEGMSCQGCADAITSALTQIPGVQSAKVSLQDKRAVVLAKASDVPNEKILAVVAAAGYQGKLVSAMPSMVVAAAGATDEPPTHGPATYPAEMNKKFVDPNAEIEPFVRRFENQSRDIYVKRQDIVRSVGVRPGDAVADIGAGTGLFTLLFARQVGPMGTVYAVDIAPAFLKHIAEEAQKQEGGGTITPVLNTQDSAMLPPNAIDLAFICDSYHHFEHPDKMLASIHRALRPNGRLVIIDFDLRKDSSDFVKQRARAPKEVYDREITAAGFEPTDTKDAPAIKDNFYAEFRRVDSKP